MRPRTSPRASARNSGGSSAADFDKETQPGADGRAGRRRRCRPARRPEELHRKLIGALRAQRVEVTQEMGQVQPVWPVRHGDLLRHRAKTGGVAHFGRCLMADAPLEAQEMYGITGDATTQQILASGSVVADNNSAAAADSLSYLSQLASGLGMPACTLQASLCVQSGRGRHLRSAHRRRPEKATRSRARCSRQPAAVGMRRDLRVDATTRRRCSSQAEEQGLVGDNIAASTRRSLRCSWASPRCSRPTSRRAAAHGPAWNGLNHCRPDPWPNGSSGDSTGEAATSTAAAAAFPPSEASFRSPGGRRVTQSPRWRPNTS